MELLSIDPSSSCLRSPFLYHFSNSRLSSFPTPQSLLLGHHCGRAFGDLRLRLAYPFSTQANTQTIL